MNIFLRGKEIYLICSNKNQIMLSQNYAEYHIHNEILSWNPWISLEISTIR
jgi:hypothetical protein